jgi:membrane associated rhomboid family serine protease
LALIAKSNFHMTDLRPGGIQRMPTIVKNIIIINVLMVIIQLVLWSSKGINLADYLGLHYWQSPLFRWWQPITHIFMHGTVYSFNETLIHILFNMFGLWMFGSILENLWGPKRFLLFYMVCGLGAAFCHLIVLHIEFSSFYKNFIQFQNDPTLDHYLLFIKQRGLESVDQFNGIKNFWMSNPNCTNCGQESFKMIQGYYMSMINEPTVGASGAVFGVLFAFGYLFPNVPLYIYFIPIPIKAKWVIGGYILLELYQGLRNSAGDNVAHFAHLGGVLFAFILLKIWNKKIRDSFY